MDIVLVLTGVSSTATEVSLYLDEGRSGGVGVLSKLELSKQYWIQPPEVERIRRHHWGCP